MVFPICSAAKLLGPEQLDDGVSYIIVLFVVILIVKCAFLSQTLCMVFIYKDGLLLIRLYEQDKQ